MAKPFVSLDGERNGVRAEVWVQTGTARITEIKAPRNWTGAKDWDPATSSEKPGNVSVKVTNEHIRDGVAGWLSTSDPLYRKVVEAYAQGTDVEYRVEWQRDKNLPRETPVKELRGYNPETDRSDMSMCGKNGGNIFAGMDGMLSKEAVTDPEEDPDRGGRVSAIGQARKAKAAAAPEGGGQGLSLDATLTALATARAAGLPEGVTDAAAALALAAGATAKQVAEAGVSEQSPAQRREVARAHAKEATPYTAYNTDGRLNLGNFAVNAAFGAERFANGLLVADRLAAFEKFNAAVAAGEIEADLMDAPDVVSFGQAVGLAGVLLDLADRVQVGAYGGGRPDRMSNSHVRSRSLVYQAIGTTHPVPFGADVEVRTAWMEALVAECVKQFAALAAIAFPAERQQAPISKPAAPAAAAQAPAPEPTQQAPVEQAPAPEPTQQAPATPAQQVPAQQVGQQTRQAKPPVEGEDGYIPAAPDFVVRFGTLTNDAGFEHGPQSPVVAYLSKKFDVTLARQVHGPALQSLVEWFERQNNPALTFRDFVIRETGQDGSPKEAATA